MDAATQASVEYFLSLGFSGGGWVLAFVLVWYVSQLHKHIEEMYNERISEVKARANEAEQRAAQAELRALGASQRLNDALVYQISSPQTNLIGTMPNNVNSGGD